jgi:tRNA splicing endonuclease
MNTRKLRVIVAIFVAFAFLSGCAQIKDKFVRKKKEDPTLKRYIPVREYDVHPNMELYTKRYIFWKNWQTELLKVLGDSNQKKKITAAQEAISNLMSMKNMLVDEKGDQLQILIDEMIKLEQDIRTQRVTISNDVQVRRRLETLGRQIKAGFSYTKVGGDIRDDFRRDE